MMLWIHPGRAALAAGMVLAAGFAGAQDLSGRWLQTSEQSRGSDRVQIAYTLELAKDGGAKLTSEAKRWSTATGSELPQLFVYLDRDKKVEHVGTWRQSGNDAIVDLTSLESSGLHDDVEARLRFQFGSDKKLRPLGTESFYQLPNASWSKATGGPSTLETLGVIAGIGAIGAIVANNTGGSSSSDRDQLAALNFTKNIDGGSYSAGLYLHRDGTARLDVTLRGSVTGRDIREEGRFAEYLGDHRTTSHRGNWSRRGDNVQVELRDFRSGNRNERIFVSMNGRSVRGGLEVRSISTFYRGMSRAYFRMVNGSWDNGGWIGGGGSGGNWGDGGDDGIVADRYTNTYSINVGRDRVRLTYDLDLQRNGVARMTVKSPNRFSVDGNSAGRYGEILYFVQDFREVTQRGRWTVRNGRVTITFDSFEGRSDARGRGRYLIEANVDRNGIVWRAWDRRFYGRDLQFRFPRR